MTNIERAIDDFFAFAGAQYENPQGVEFHLVYGAVVVSIIWQHKQGLEDASLAFTYTCEDFTTFGEMFNIGEDAQTVIDNVTAKTLMNLFQRGKVAVSCSIEELNAPTLEFYRRNNKIIAIDELKIEHEVDLELRSPQDFVSFTKSFFEKNPHLKNTMVFRSGRWQSSEQIAN